VKMAVFWVVAPCSLQSSGRWIALMMEAASTSEPSVIIYQTTQKTAIFLFLTKFIIFHVVQIFPALIKKPQDPLSCSQKLATGPILNQLNPALPTLLISLMNPILRRLNPIRYVPPFPQRSILILTSHLCMSSERSLYFFQPKLSKPVVLNMWSGGSTTV
jgi:hypothetical protein